MLKIFPIDCIRQALEQELLKEHINNPNYFGGKNQVNLFSFYEQLKTQDEVDRFVENYRELSEQQNRTGLILNGVLVSPENPSITNLYSSLIIPMTFTCSFRCMLENRDQAIETINNLSESLKGRKVDIAQLKCTDLNGKTCYKPFVVGTIGENDGEPALEDGVYIGHVDNASQLQNRLDELSNMGVIVDNAFNYLYAKNNSKIKVAKKVLCKGEQLVDAIYGDDVIEESQNITGTYSLLGEWTLEQLYPFAECFVTLYGDETVTENIKNGKIEIIEIIESGGQKYTNVELSFTLSKQADILCQGWNGTFDIEDVEVWEKSYCFVFVEDDGTMPNIIFPPEHTSFEKYKLSFSFDAIRCDEPRNLNSNEYCEITFSGSATLVSNGVALGNDLLKIFVTKIGYMADTFVSFSDISSGNKSSWLEPLELPSGSNANTKLSQLVSNRFKTNTHTDSLALSLQYTFILDRNIALLNQWFNYARYGTQGLTVDDITPNLIYGINELWCSWGDFEVKEIKAKIVENIDIENTESDTLTLSVTMQIQGDNL